MSGAAGLSAARRRRAGAQPRQNQVISINSQQKNTTQSVPRGRISVQSILENHELRLRELEPKLESLVESVSNYEQPESDSQKIDVGLLDTVATNSTEVKALNSKIDNLSGLLSDLQTVVLRLSNKVADLQDNTVQSANVLVEVSGSDDATLGTLEEVSLGSVDEVDTTQVDGSDNVQQTEGTSSEDTDGNVEVANNDAEVEESTEVNEQ